jgi:16S rRNA (guanine(966)-N(2))-methyltransferase RsmD
MTKSSYQVRVLAGQFKGRRLKYPGTPTVRPTMQRTKESVFASLGGEVAGAMFIDLYAGAGGIGIEAISRGAAFVHFVENGRAALDCLRDNLTHCEIARDRFRVHAAEAFDFLRAAASRDIRPNLVYADPPYAVDPGVLLEFLARIDYPPGGLVMLEHPKKVVLAAPGQFARFRFKTFGQTQVSFFVRAEGEVL